MKRISVFLLVLLMLMISPTASYGLQQWEEAIADVWDPDTSSFRYTIVSSESGLDVAEETALTNTVHPLATFTHTTSGTPANGIGLSLDWYQETAAANTELGARIAVIATDTTAASEDFQIDWMLMTAGATSATKMSLGSTGVVTLVNDATIDNSTNGIVKITEPLVTIIGNNAIQNAAQTAGIMTLHTVTASSGALTGATDKIEVDIPSGALLIACQLNVDVAVTNAGDNTWAAAYSGGSTAEIAAAATAATKNTKINAFHDANAATAITSGETDITLTPQGADFTAGEITAVCYYRSLTSMDDEP